MAKKTAYYKDTTFLQEFLAGRLPCLSLDSSDIKRAERFLLQLTTTHDRPLYVTIKGHGVFRRQIGEVDFPVVKFINEEFLHKIISNNSIPEITTQEIKAVDEYFSELDTHNQDASRTNMATGGKGIENFPDPILNIRVTDLNDILTPVDCHSDKVTDVVGHSQLILDEFLVRLRIKVRSSQSAPMHSRINPKLLNMPTGAPGSPSPPVMPANEIEFLVSQMAKAWMTELPSAFGMQYGIEAQNQPSAWNQCLSMIARAQVRADIVLLMEGFKGEMPDVEGRVTQQDSVRDLEWAIRKLENSTNQIVLMAPRVEWKDTTVDKMLIRYTLNFPDLDDLDELVRSVLSTVYGRKPKLYLTLLNKIIGRVKPGLNITPEDLEEQSDEDIVDEGTKLVSASDAFDRSILKIVNSLRGLTETRVQNIVWSSIRTYTDLDPGFLDQSRKEIINQTAGLKVIDIEVVPGEDAFENVGGLDELKRWIKSRGNDLFLTADEAKEKLGGYVYKGILLIGLPGTGKSLITKSIAKYLASQNIDYPVSLVFLDTGSLRGSYVGETEKNTRDALMMVEAFSPCVLWIDEIEKAFSSGGDTSSEIGRRMLGYFLTWMQERQSPVFLVATANDISSLPPEFTREGRWDAKFFTPLPDAQAAVQIMSYVLSRFKLSLEDIISQTQNGKRKLYLWSMLAQSGNFEGRKSVIMRPKGEGLVPLEDEDGVTVERDLGYSGSEIESAVKEAISNVKALRGQSWKSSITVDDLIISLKNLTPISRRFDDKGNPMGYVMYKLEQAGVKTMSDQEYEQSVGEIDIFSKNLKDAQGNELSDSEVEEFLKELKSLSKIVSPKKSGKEKRKNPLSSYYLLGDGLFESLYG